MDWITLAPSRGILVSIGPVAVHWYGLMYALAFLVGAWMLPRLLPLRRIQLSSRQTESLVVAVILGVLLGGRLGYVLLYGGSEYWRHPLLILAIWRGGMASHGGFVGVLIALLVWTRRNRIPLLALTDVLVVPIAIGLAFGRIGNFINGELAGTLTSLPWGMHFPGLEGLRHPVQLYAVLKDLSIALVLFLTLRRHPPLASGVSASLFLILYGLLRFIVEFFRDQPLGLMEWLWFPLTPGQVYSLPIFFVGVALLTCVLVRLNRGVT